MVIPSIFSASTDGERSIAPGEGENLAAGADGEEPAASTDGGTPDQPTSTSGNATPQGNAEEKYQNDCGALLAQAVSDAELLAVYVSRNGMHVGRDGKAVTLEVLQGVTDARQRLVSHTLNGGAAAAFLSLRLCSSKIVRIPHPSDSNFPSLVNGSTPLPRTRLTKSLRSVLQSNNEPALGSPF
jgi:hypothetical protein